MHRGWTLAVILLVCACATTPPLAPPTPAEQPADFPAATYRRAAKLGKPVYRVDPRGSQLTVLVGRTGTLAHLGHDHVLATRQIQGSVLGAEDPSQAQADVYVALAALEVDPPPLRVQTGLKGQLTAAEIAQTREHMLHDVLDAQRNPWITVHATWARDAPRRTVLMAQVTLHGVSRSVRIPVAYRRDQQRIEVSGRLQVRQSDFGLIPYSLLGGALAVDDTLRLSFHIEATRIDDRPTSLPSG